MCDPLACFEVARIVLEAASITTAGLVASVAIVYAAAWLTLE